MPKIDLYNVELFESLLELDFQEKNIDIHNDYELKNIVFKNNKNLQLLLTHNLSDNKFLLSFYDTEFIEFDLPTNKNIYIDNFYRGRYELNNELYDEFNNKKCFYIEFCETGHLNILCSKLTLLEL